MKNRKTQDPTEAALSAIEDALNLGKEAPEVTTQPADRRAGPPPAPEPVEEVFAQRPRPHRERPQRRPAANDDRPSVGQIMAALHRKPSSAPILLATLVSMIWIVGGAVLAAARVRDDAGAVMPVNEIVLQPWFMPVLAAILLPPVLFFLLATLIRRSQEMRHISRAMTEVTLRLAEPEGVSTDAIVSVGQAIRREVAALGDGIERAIARASELESMVRNEVSTLERAYDENESRVRSLVDELHSERDSIVQHSSRLREAIAGAHETFSFDVQNVADRISSALDNATGNLTDNITLRAEDARTNITSAAQSVIDTITARAEDARTNIASAGQTVVDNFAEKSTQATDRLTQVGVEIAKAIADRNEKVSETFQQSANELHSALSERASAISEMITQTGQTFENTIGSQLNELADTVLMRGNEVAGRVSADANALGARITEGLQTFDTTVKVFGNNLISEMKGTIGAVADASRDSLTAFDERLAGKSGEITDAIDARIGRIEQTLESRATSLNETLANRTLEFARTITDGAKTATDAVDKTVAGMGEYFSTKAQEMANTISERAEKIDETLGQRAMEITETLDSRVNKFEDLIVTRLEAVTNSVETKGIAVADQLVAKVDDATSTLTRRVDDATGDLTRRVDDATTALTQRVDNATAALTQRTETAATAISGRIDGVSGALAVRIENTSEILRANAASVETSLNELADGIARNFVERVNNISSSHETLRTEVRDIIAELGNTHRLLQATIDTASSTLGPIEGKIAEKVAAFHHSLDSAISSTRSTAERMDTQIRELNAASSGVLRDVSSLTVRFEEQVRLVSSTTETLNETHRRIDQGMVERRHAIEEVANLLGQRSTDLEERLTRFNAMLEQSFGEAETKTQDIAKLVADTTATATQSIARQYELIRNSSTEERDRTNAALKDTYNEAMDSVNALFSDANQRFVEAARDLREISDDIQRTLDQTREEVRRTVFDLPAETKESANAMRRVVADQIKALSELNDIVARHGRGAGVEMAAPPSYDYREEEMLAVGGRSAPRNALPRPAARPDFEDDMAPARSRLEAPDARRPDRGSRLNEVLAKAPRDNDAGGEREGGSAIESLDALSIDIARMIDHDVAADAWDRYKRGERGVFTRRLYTNAGQKSFEEIRRKYRRSADFRETVDRYIDEFERLLEQVSRDDRGQALTKTYLTSDTGKVYTLLAHASGRLG